MRKLVVAAAVMAAGLAGLAFAHGGPWGPAAGGYGCGGYASEAGTGPGPGMGPGMGYGMGRWGGGPQLEGLGLSPEQREKIAAARGDFVRQMEKARLDQRERIEAILTPEQRERLRGPGRS